MGTINERPLKSQRPCHLLPPTVSSSNRDDVAIMAQGAMDDALTIDADSRRKSIAAAAQFVATDFLVGTEQPRPLAEFVIVHHILHALSSAHQVEIDVNYPIVVV
jgi:hypothetical protein